MYNIFFSDVIFGDTQQAYGDLLTAFTALIIRANEQAENGLHLRAVEDFLFTSIVSGRLPLAIFAVDVWTLWSR